MAQDNHTPLSTGAAAQAATFNSVFSALDSAIKKNNYAATAAPTTGDDTADGYTVGSRWIDVTNDRVYVALDVTLGAAIWHRTDIPLLGGKLMLNDTADAQNTNGLTINQLGADDGILNFKSSDFSGGFTSLVETDTFTVFSKNHAIDGGLRVTPYTSATEGLLLLPRVTTEDATRSTVARAPTRIDGALKSGTSVGNMSANQNLLCVATNGVTRFILDTDGDSHQDVGTAWTNFDSHDDLALLHQLSAHVTRRNDPLRKGFGAWLKTNRAQLEKLKLVTFNRDGHHFVNMSRLTMLLVGAMRQIGERMEQLENEKRPRRGTVRTNRKPAIRKTRNAANRRIARGVV